MPAVQVGGMQCISVGSIRAPTETAGGLLKPTMAAFLFCIKPTMHRVEKVSEISVGDFFGNGRSGPEHQALLTMIAELVRPPT